MTKYDPTDLAGERLRQVVDELDAPRIRIRGEPLANECLDLLGEGHERTDELAQEIKVFVRERHSAYAYPREIEFVDDLPKTLTGKIRRIELREREAGKA